MADKDDMADEDANYESETEEGETTSVEEIVTDGRNYEGTNTTTVTWTPCWRDLWQLRQ